MSTWPLIKFVDSPAVGATVRYDFNDQGATPAKKVLEFDAGVPSLEGDPDAVGQTWGFRSPQIVHTIKGTKAQAMAALAAVSREQLRRTNWLLFQPSAATQPVWFKTYRTGYQPITLDQVFVRIDGGGTVPLPDTWKITIPLVADAFTYGARVTMSTFQVIQGPADLTGPTRTAMRVVLPTIKGDAPTALRVTITPAAGQTVGGSTFPSKWMIGCVAGETTMVDTVYDIGTGDGFTAGTNTGAGVANAAYFGGSYRLVSVTASDNVAGNNFSRRLTGSLTAPPIGRYKVMLRWEGGSAIQRDFLFAFGQLVNALPTYQYGPTVVVRHLGHQGWVDLGEFSFPMNQAVPDSVAATSPAVPFAIKIGTADNASEAVRIDALKLIPVAGRTVFATNLVKASFAPGSASALASSVVGTFDGDAEAFWAVNGSNVLLDNPSGSLAGTFPVANPAAPQNLLLVMATDNGAPTAFGATGATTSLNVQAAVDVSYYPRYLHVGDGT